MCKLKNELQYVEDVLALPHFWTKSFSTRSNQFHNYEHASHVTMSVSKMLSRIVAPEIEEPSAPWYSTARHISSWNHSLELVTTIVHTVSCPHKWCQKYSISLTDVYKTYINKRVSSLSYKYLLFDILGYRRSFCHQSYGLSVARRSSDTLPDWNRVFKQRNIDEMGKDSTARYLTHEDQEEKQQQLSFTTQLSLTNFMVRTEEQRRKNKLLSQHRRDR